MRFNSLAYPAVAHHPRSLPRIAALHPRDHEVQTTQRCAPFFHLRAYRVSQLASAQNVVTDVRIYHAHKIMAMSARSTMQHLHPRLMALHDLTMRAAMPDPKTGLIRMPGLMRDSYIFMESYGIYLIGTFAVS